MQIDVIQRNPVQVAYLRYSGPLGDPLERFWRGTVALWLADHGLIDCPRYGVFLDDPRHTAPDRCRYDACVELPPGLNLPDAPLTTICGGRHAVTRFKGTGAEIGAAWGRMAAACLERRLVADAGRPSFEFYPRGACFDRKSGNLACELCLPLGS